MSDTASTTHASSTQVSTSVRLPANTVARINQHFNALPQLVALQTFSELGGAITNATGGLSVKATTALNKIAKEFVTTNGVIMQGVGQISGILGNFLYLVFDYVGSGEIPQGVLAEMQDLCRSLNTDFVARIGEFSNHSAANFLVVYTELTEQSGGNFPGLKQDRDVLAGQIDVEEVKLTELVSAVAKTVGNKAYLESDLAFAASAIADAGQAKASMQAEVDRLRNGDMPRLQAELLERRDTHHEERGRFLFISWRERTVHVDNGERLVRENIARCQGRVAELEQRIRTFNIDAEIARTNKARDDLAKLSTELPRQQEKVNQQRAHVAGMKEDLRRKDEQLEAILARAETLSPVAIQNANNLAKAILGAALALQQASGQFTSQLTGIRSSPYAITGSTLSAMTLYKLCQDYLHNRQALPNMQQQFLAITE